MKKLSITLLISLYISCAYANILQVPSAYNSIQAAVNASTNGDTVLVSPGVYYENINFKGRKILLTSMFYLTKDTMYVSSTIINGGTPLQTDTASCVIFNSGEDSTSILQGFTLTGGLGTKWTDIHGAGIYREGGGILMDLSSPTIRYNIISNNQAINTTGVTSAGGGGIRIGDGNPIIQNNIIINNQGKYGPGIVLNYTGGTIRNNLIAHNTGATSYGGGGAIWIYNNQSSNYQKLIENNTLINNASYTAGSGGIYVESATNVIIHNNIIWNNTPLTTQIKTIGATPQATYNDVENGYTGTGNINANPLLDICSLLSTGSPCIDAGDSATKYNDISTSSTVALFPSTGTQHNDIGVFGGPNAFLLNCTSSLTGIKNLSPSDDVEIYPNPAVNYFILNSNKSGNEYEINLYDMKGQLFIENKFVKTAEKINFQIEPGIYFLKITDKASGRFCTKKIIIML